MCLGTYRIRVKLVLSALGKNYTEVEVHKRKDKAFQILHQVEECSQPLGILVFLHLSVRTYLGGLQSNFLLAHPHHQLLFAYFIGFGPFRIGAVKNTAFQYDLLHLIDDSFRYEGWVCGLVPCFRMS